MGIKQSRYHRYNRSYNHQHKPRDNSPRRESVNTNTTSGVSQSNNSVTIDGRQYYQDETSIYILPRDEIEQDRLNSQHFTVKAMFNGKNILDSIQRILPKEASVLDLGCGTGCWVMELAVEYPEYRFTGVDVTDMFPTTIRPENVNFEIYNVLSGLPYPDNTFDFVNMRFMLSAFAVSDWPVVLKETYRVLKPGGVIELMETQFPENDRVPIVRTVNEAFYEMLRENGKDPCTAAKFGTMLKEQHFKVIERQERSLTYKKPLEPISREMLGNWKMAMLALKPVLVHKIVENPDEYSSVIDDYIEGLIEEHWTPKLIAWAAQKPFIDTSNDNSNNILQERQ
ncbi:hypothetical protein G6F68_005757 [Rhizopus microsporus]|nr:hypothetical protein G6F67_004935 [Rhizopus microsporus]KAG1262666.1 hypothetical protein G6F68_005757 [Rhizopus microsporus]